jgi:N-acetylmuramoyl-L-alanine amidase
MSTDHGFILNQVMQSKRITPDRFGGNGDYCVYIDAGHGGIHPTTGKYTTAPKKMFRHDGLMLHDGPNFYEGVSNRVYAEMFAIKCIQNGISYVKCYHPWKDTYLSTRAAVANKAYKEWKRGFFLSFHHNASSYHNASGWSIWTSKGNTKSDNIGDIFWYATDKRCGNTIKMRSQVRPDGDKDYEADFTVLVKTIMGAVLLEDQFFDYPDDVKQIVNMALAEIKIDGYIDATKQVFDKIRL